jgi:protein-S-isoprenylcysteine O-methyltransferase Ste14
VTTMRALELKIPPPVVALLCGYGAWELCAAVPDLTFDWPGRVAMAVLVASVGFSLDVVSILRFLAARTTVNPLTPGKSERLVTDGLYRHTRNPMYVGLLLILCGLALYLGNPVALAAPAVFVAYITRFQIIPEERMLAAKFGADYDDYRAAVRRWL